MSRHTKNPLRIVVLPGLDRVVSAVLDGQLVVAQGRTHAETGRRIVAALRLLDRK